MLNAFKCTVASAFFLMLVPFRLHIWRAGLGLSALDSGIEEAWVVNATVAESPSRVDGPVARVDMLVLSAFLGIAIGDIVWLEALQHLGASKLILVDSVKPFVSSWLAFALMVFIKPCLTACACKTRELYKKEYPSPDYNEPNQGETTGGLAAVGILVTMLGILVVALPSRSFPSFSASSSEDPPKTCEQQQQQQPQITETSTRQAANKAAPRSEAGWGRGTECERCGSKLLEEAAGLVFCPACGRHPHPSSSLPSCRAASPRPSAALDTSASSLPHPPQDDDVPLLRQASLSIPLPVAAEGFAYALLNVFVDVFGAILTKLYGQGLQAWEINLIRFGSAAVMLDLVLLIVGLRAWYRWSPPCVIRMQEPDALSLSSLQPAQQAGLHQEQRAVCERRGSWRCEVPVWARLPPLYAFEWAYVTLGAVFCTLLTPVLSTTALFKVAVGPPIPIAHLFIFAASSRAE
jgi:hypothetical protein